MTDHEKSLTNDQSLELQPRVQIYTDEDDNNEQGKHRFAIE